MTLRRPSLAVLTICLATIVMMVAAGGLVLMLGRAVPADAAITPVPADPAVRAEFSFTYASTLARLLEGRCGKMETHALDAASEVELHEEPEMAALAVAAATRRAESLTKKSCGYVDDEIDAADRKARGGSIIPTAQPAH